MEKVKIFSYGSSNEFRGLESEVNEWLGSNKEIEVISRHVAGSGGTNEQGKSFVNCTIVFFYRILS